MSTQSDGNAYRTLVEQTFGRSRKIQVDIKIDLRKNWLRGGWGVDASSSEITSQWVI
jgi:hypothetical protein